MISLFKKKRFCSLASSSRRLALRTLAKTFLPWHSSSGVVTAAKQRQAPFFILAAKGVACRRETRGCLALSRVPRSLRLLQGAGARVNRSIRAGGFLELAELIDLQLCPRGTQLRSSSGIPWLESLIAEYGLQGADVHIGAALHLGDAAWLMRGGMRVRVGGAKRKVPRLRSG
jgi:hypothetical protein